MGEAPAHNDEAQAVKRRFFRRFCSFPLVVAAILAGLAAYVEYRFDLIRTAPAIPDAGAPRDSIGFEVVLRPLLALDWIEARTELDGAPRWLAKHCLPREVGMLMKTGPLPEPLILTLFVNSQRMTPLFVSLLNRARLLPDTPCLAWDAMGFHSPRAGLAAAHAIVQSGQVAFADYRIVDTVLPPREPAGQDLIEVLLDNRDGQVLAALMAVHAAMAAEPPFYTPRELARNLECVLGIYAGASLVDDALAGRCRFLCLPDAAETAVADLAYLAEVVREEGARALRDAWGLGLFLDTRREGTDIVCDFRVDGMTQLLERLVEGM
ncbi:MAG: hypothetical protein KA184_12800 [Candidatus Hydrogenedentes bacterium]|nr:hypothetical protein [Candidatus Hydrogenedentota bacterium]